MRELFVEELEGVVGGQELPNVHDYVQTTMACCEETFSCCWWWDVIDNIAIDIQP